MSAEKRAKEEAPEQALQRLTAELEAGRIAPAYLLRGEERYFRERLAERILAAAAKRGLELCRHDAKHPEFLLARLCDDLRGNALFASARCVLVQHVTSLVTKSSREHSAALVELLQARLASPEGSIVVLTAETLGAENPVAKSLRAAGGEVVPCRKLWDSLPPWGDSNPARIELVAWLLARARAEGVGLRTEEALFVVQAVGNDLFALESELARLRERGARSVSEIVGWQAGASPFTIAEDLARGDARSAARGLEALWQGGFQGRDGQRTRDEGGLVAMLLGALYSKVREAVAYASALERGASEAEAVAAVGGSSAPRAVEALRQRLSMRPPRAWRKLLEDVADLERRAHTGSPVDVNDFQWLALRWRVLPSKAGGAARG